MVKPRVLVVDDKFDMAETIADGLLDQGYDAVPCGSSQKAVSLLSSDGFDALVTDLRMPGVDGMELLATSLRLAPERPVIVMTAYGAIDTAVESIRKGAYQYLTKPFKLEELVVFLQRALEDTRFRSEALALKKAFRQQYARSNLLGKSERMKAVFDVVDRVADTAAPVLLVGETGTGKGLVAHTLHAESTRSARRFITVNCAALPEPLLESELFGHVKGAFTGATTSKPGLFAEAHQGTLFLDEIGDIAPALQGKLLDALERGAIRAVGATKERQVDVRIIAATNRNLRECVRSGAFREDLFYRLEVITIALPALRERREDIPLLLERYLREMKRRHPSSPVKRITAPAMARLLDYAWPGNVRELVHTMERIVLLGTGPEITLTDFPAEIHDRATPTNSALASAPGAPSSALASAAMLFPFDGAVILPIREIQRRYAVWALERMGGHRTRTAEKLGIDMKTLAKWLGDESEGTVS